MKIGIKKLDEDGVIPKKQTKGAACYDLYAPCDFLVPNGSRCVLPLKIAIELPYGYRADVKPRSGFSSNGIEGVSDICTRENLKRFDADVKIGTIDSDYRGGFGVIIKNYGEQFFILKGTRIAQLEIAKVEDVEFVEVEELGESERSVNGFGSTGTH